MYVSLSLRVPVGSHAVNHRALSGVYQPVITQPLQNDVLFVELCVITCLVWTGPLMTGLDTPIKGPSIHVQGRRSGGG